MFKNIFEPEKEIPHPMEVLNASHLDKHLQWQFDPQYDTQDLFQKLQVIGKGGFGTVCKVLHIPSNTILAGKLINPKLVNDPSTRKEIDHEISLMHEVDSEYTVHYYGSVQYKGSMMILMEYCDCGSLRDILDAREQVLSEDQISIVMHDLLKGLQLIRFQYRIVHRDIKAANILFTSKGEIKLADFGVSRRFEKQGTVHTRTIVGTPYWMAPEVINGRPYSYSADIWSVGITAVELAEGAPPYVEYAPTKAMIEISLKGFPGYRFKNMHSPEFLDFVSHCVQMDADKRWDIPSLLNHPFIMRAERMPRLEVLDDLIQYSTNSAALVSHGSNHSIMGSTQFSGTNPFESDAFNSQNDQFGNGANLSTAHNFDGFDSFSNSRNGAMLNSATNFDSFQNGNMGFDTAALNSRNDFNSFSSQQGENGNLYMLNDQNYKGFDSFAGSQNYPSFTEFDTFAKNGQNFNGFDSTALNSSKDFDSFAHSPYFPNNGFDSFASNQNGTNLKSAKGFDSFANSPYSPNEPSGFDSFAANRSSEYQLHGFDSFAMNPNQKSGFDSFASHNNSFASPLNQFDSSKFDSFNSSKFNSNNQFDSSKLSSSNGFDSFQSGNGFDSFSTRNQANIPSATNFDSFVAMRNNGFDSTNLKSQIGFNSFMRSSPIAGNNNTEKELPSFNSFIAQQEQTKPSVSNIKPGYPPLPPRPNKDPRVSFSQIPDDVFRQVSRTNSLRTPFVSFKPDQLGKSKDENGQPLKVYYQKDDSIHNQQVIREDSTEIHYEKPSMWSPSPLFLLFFFLIAIEFGPEGFVIATFFSSVFFFFFHFGKNKVKNHNGLVAHHFQDQ